MSAAGNLWHGTLPRMAVYPISPRKDWVRIFASASSAPSASSANPPKGNGTSDLAENNRRTVGDLADGISCVVIAIGSPIQARAKKVGTGR